jgi:pimeloyl-ACP methyl ester carboxylesterase
MRTVPYDTSRDALYRPHLGPSIFPNTGSPEESLLCAEASRLAYKYFERDQKGEIETALQSVGFHDFQYFNRGGSQAFAAWNSQRALLAFRGTEESQEDPTDLGDDLKFLWSPWGPGGQVHKGFDEALSRIWDEIESWLKNHSEPLLLTGHSLGAALATLAAGRIGPARRLSAKLITFGSPRVGDAGFIATLKGLRFSRYVDCCDLVCRMPPGNIPIEHRSFEHLEPSIYIDRLGRVTPGATEKTLREDGEEARKDYLLHHAWRWGQVALRDLADHAPINYVYALGGR